MNNQIMPFTWLVKIARFYLALLLSVAISAKSAAALSVNPQDGVRSFYDTLLTTMKAGRTLGQSGRYARLAPVIGRLFDVPLMARLAVGSSWASLPTTQQQQVTEAFGHYISATYADRFDSYSGEQLQVTGEQPYGAEVIVQTRIVKGNGDTVSLNYRMHENGGSWQIADVYMDGTISQLATQRSEFHSILQRGGVDGLIMALNRKVDLLTRNLAKSS
jgi:phospholipid transport system substrate-binding protein